MIEIRDLGSNEINEVIARNSYGHLGCSLHNVPYVIPIHYGYEEPYIYIFTTQGKKTDIISDNPEVCIQIEEVVDDKNWISVVVNGEADEVMDDDERGEALKLITTIDPELTPALSIRWMDNWIQENISVLYRITPMRTTGRATVPGSDIKRPFTPPTSIREVW